MFKKHYCLENKLSIMLLTSALLTVLLVSSLAAPIAFSVQPPVDISTYYVGTIGQPARMDPARAYDTASGELLQNVYQTLIWWNDKHPVTFTPGLGYNLQVSDYSDLDSYTGVLAAEVPTMANGRIVINNTDGSTTWRFTINTNALFQPWKDHTGVIQPARNITAADVVYSFRRQVVYDSIYSPDWMWMTPAFGYANFRNSYGGPYATYSNGTFTSPADEAAAGALITNWCYNIGNDVYFYFQLPWAEGPLKQIFAQTWGGVVNPDFVKEYGGWDGLFTTGASTFDMSAGWTNNYRNKPTTTRSELDTYKDPAAFPGHGSKYSSFAFAACGTGPYTFTSWDQTKKTWRIDAFSQYWLGFGQAGNKYGNYIHTVIEKGIDAYPTRKMLFLEGEFDTAVIPRANMYDLLTSTYNPIPGVNLVYNVASLSNDVMLYGFKISSASPYQAYVGYPTHIGGAQQYFFNNTHIRQAFAWALNYTAYIQDAWFGEALAQRSWWVDGLSPAAYKNTNSSMPQRNLDYTEMQNALNLAVIQGTNVGTAGFDVTLAYNIGNDQRLIACNLIAQAFQALNPKYHVTVIGLDWPVFLDAENSGYLPMYDVGWLANFADPDNFCEPYQATWGTFMNGQIYPTDNAQPPDQSFIDGEISAAMVEPNFVTRGAMYRDLQYRYWLDVPSFPLIQPVGRRFARDWVQGWYYNALLPGEYAYDLYKSIVSNPGVDVDATNTITPGPGPTYTLAEIVHGGMYLGYRHLLAHEGMSYTAHVKYIAGAVANLVVAIGLKRNSTLETQYPAANQVILSPGQSATDIFWWSEDGVNQVVLADNAQEGTSHSGTIYTVGLEAYPVNGQDTNPANNYVVAGLWNASRLIGDIYADGIVDIYDALRLASAYGSTSARANWNPDADLNSDGKVDIFDAILLSANFNKHVGNEGTIAYTLTITTTVGGTTNPLSGAYSYSAGFGVDVRATPNSGYYFDHWELDGANVGSTNPIHVTMSTSHTLEAVFSLSSVLHTLDITTTAGGTTNPAPGTYTYSQGTNVPVQANPDTGYGFDHWELDGLNVGSTNPYSVLMDNNHQLHAVFVQINYTLTITATVGGTTSPSPDSYSYSAGTNVSVTAMPDTYYSFDHWELDGVNVGSANPYSVLMDTNHTLHAVFSLLSYTLTITSTSGGTTDPAPNSYVYDAGTNKTVTAIANTYYRFDHWELDGTNVGSTDQYSVLMDDNHTLHAVFVQINYTLTITASAGGTTNPAPDVYTYAGGSDVQVIPIPDPGYRFDHWELDGLNIGSTNPLDVIVDTDHELRAVFTLSTQDVHDVAVTNVASSKDGCLPMPTAGQGFNVTIKVTVANQGNFTETFNVAVYANATSIASQNVTLTNGNSADITFTWNTTGFAYGNYTISAYAEPVPGETNIANNFSTDGTIYVGKPGDLNGDGRVDLYDAIILSNAFAATPSNSNWNPNADINNDNIIDIYDAIILSTNFD